MNILNRLIIKANEPKTISQILMAFGIPITLVFGIAFLLNPNFISLKFLLVLIGVGLVILAFSLRKKRKHNT